MRGNVTQMPPGGEKKNCMFIFINSHIDENDVLFWKLVLFRKLKDNSKLNYQQCITLNIKVHYIYWLNVIFIKANLCFVCKVFF